MEKSEKFVGLAGLFDREEELLAAARLVRDAGYRKWDCHTPFPVHGLNHAMGLRGSILPAVCLAMGFVGVAAALLMQGWITVVDYPLVVGGKPFWSWPGFVPITFELFVGFTAVTIVAALIYFCRLWRFHSPLHDSGVMAQITSRRFGLILDATDENFGDGRAAEELLARAGCRDIRKLVERHTREPLL